MANNYLRETGPIIFYEDLISSGEGGLAIGWVGNISPIEKKGRLTVAVAVSSDTS